MGCIGGGAILVVRHLGGRIVTISSTSGVRGDDFASHYSASKFGVIGLTQSMAVESGRFGTTVNATAAANSIASKYSVLPLWR